MKEFNLIIGKAIIPKVSPKNKYELVIKYMSGDANGYTNQSWFFNGLNDLISKWNPTITLNTVLNFIYQYKQLDWNSQCSFKEYIDFDKKIMEEMGNCDFFPGDSTCDYQVPARPDEFNLYWWDINGTKYDVYAFDEAKTQLLPGNR